MDDVITAHDAYLSEVLDRALLAPHHEELNLQIQQLLHIVLRFCNLEETLIAGKEWVHGLHCIRCCLFVCFDLGINIHNCQCCTCARCEMIVSLLFSSSFSLLLDAMASIARRKVSNSATDERMKMGVQVTFSFHFFISITRSLTGYTKN